MMNKSHLAAILLTVSISHSVLAGTGLNCREANQMEGESLGHCTEQSDRELNEMFKLVMNETHTGHQKLLREAQQAWIKMRDADCKFREAIAAGYERGVAKDRCLIRRTMERIDQLDAMRNAAR